MMGEQLHITHIYLSADRLTEHYAIVLSLKPICPSLPLSEDRQTDVGQDCLTVKFYKDIYTKENLRKMGLNERQIKAVRYVKEKGKITNKEYQELNKVSKRTTSRDLEKLVKMDIVIQIGITGRGTEYNLKGVK